MRFLRWLFEKSEEPPLVEDDETRNDAEFGWIGRVDDEGGWEAIKPLPFLEMEVGFFLPGNKDGPTMDERVLFRELVSRYPDMCDDIVQAISKDIGEPVSITDLQLIHISIHPKVQPRIELSYASPLDVEHGFRVEVYDWNHLGFGRG